MISSGVCEGAAVFLAEQRKKKINIMSSNCLCVHPSLFSSSLLLFFPFLSPNSQTAASEQQISCTEVPFGELADKRERSLRGCFWLHQAALHAASIQDVVPNPLQVHFYTQKCIFTPPPLWSRSGLISLANIPTGYRQRIALNQQPYLGAPLIFTFKYCLTDMISSPAHLSSSFSSCVLAYVPDKRSPW